MELSSPPLREALLNAAEDEIDEHGIAAVGMRSIARRVGVSHQAPGHHFGDRRGLLTALAIKGFRVLEELMRAARAASPEDATAAERVASTGLGYAQMAELHPSLFVVMFRPEILDDDDPALAQARESAFGFFAGEIADARSTGWGVTYDASAVALTCWSTVHGAVALWRDGTLGTFFPEIPGVQDAADLVTRTLNSALAAADQAGG